MIMMMMISFRGTSVSRVPAGLLVFPKCALDDGRQWSFSKLANSTF